MAAAKLPTFPKFDLDALVALQKANIETMMAAQKIMIDFAQTLAGRNMAMGKESFAQVEAMLSGGLDTKKQPQAFVDEAKVSVEKVVANAKESVDLGVKAQKEVVDLLVARANANLEQVKTLAA